MIVHTLLDSSHLAGNLLGQRRRIIGLDMAIHHPARVTKLAVTRADSRTDGYTAERRGATACSRLSRAR